MIIMNDNILMILIILRWVRVGCVFLPPFYLLLYSNHLSLCRLSLRSIDLEQPRFPPLPWSTFRFLDSNAYTWIARTVFCSGLSGASFLPSSASMFVHRKLRKARNRLFVNQLNELIRDHDHRHSLLSSIKIIPRDFAAPFPNPFLLIGKTLSSLSTPLPPSFARSDSYDSISIVFHTNLSIELRTVDKTDKNNTIERKLVGSGD